MSTPKFQLLGSLKAQQADLAVNDPNDPAYIKNRNCYKYTIAEADEYVFQKTTYIEYFDSDGPLYYSSDKTYTKEDLINEVAPYKLERWYSEGNWAGLTAGVYSDIITPDMITEFEGGFYILQKVFVITDYTACNVISYYTGNKMPFNANGIYLQDTDGRFGDATRLYRDEVVDLKTLDNDFLDLPNNEDFKGKQDRLINKGGSILAAYVANRDTEETSLLAVTSGVAAGVIPIRDEQGRIRACGLGQEPKDGDYMTSLNEVKGILSKSTVIELAKDSSYTIPSDAFGVFMMFGDSVSVTYNTTEPKTVTNTEKNQILIKLKAASENVWLKHIGIGQGTFSMPKTTVNEGIIGTNEITVTNTSSTYGLRIYHLNAII